ncbi:MAG: thioredoxin family protein [Bacteroidota bacterium]
MKELIEKGLENAMSYPAYRQLLTDLLAEGKTTGPNQSDFYIEIAKLNQRRMDRLDKRVKLSEALEQQLKSLQKSYLLLTLTEGWCGDAAQSMPVINQLAENSDKVELKVVLRDEHTALMDQFLTDGGRSIPKVIVLDTETNEVLGAWGPRPAPAQKLAMDYKYKPVPKEPYEEFNVALHTWYARDKTQTTQSELLNLFSTLEEQ